MSKSVVILSHFLSDPYLRFMVSNSWLPITDGNVWVRPVVWRDIESVNGISLQHLSLSVHSKQYYLKDPKKFKIP